MSGPAKQRWVFHPYEMALVGYQNSGKTTLAAKLVAELGLDLAYIKRDAHRFEMDKPGKDTHTLAAAGAAAVFISDPRSRALIRRAPLDPLLAGLDFLDQDAALVEGHKQTPVPKIVVLDEEREIAAESAFLTQAPLAAVGPWNDRPPLPWDVPYFRRDDAAAVAAFIRARWDELTAGRPVLGLVLTGGKSERMGSDKAALDYGRGEEARRVYSLLGEFCAEVFVSCRPDQADLDGRRGLPQIHDRFLGLGPLSGILSAFEARPDATWLVAACDLPRLGRESLAALLANRHPFRFATAFRHADGVAEPLCALYEPKARPRLYQLLAAGHSCPRRLLEGYPTKLIDEVEGNQLDNVNERAEREEVLHDFRA